jgi:hypothetical protein
MPRTTERSELLDTIDHAYQTLAYKLAHQILRDETLALLQEDSDSDSDSDMDLDGWERWDASEEEDVEDGETDEEEEEEEEREFRRLFHHAGFAMLDNLDRMRRGIEATRYVADRALYPRGLVLGRAGVLEWYFTMDEKWFRSQVSRRFPPFVRFEGLPLTTGLWL